MKDHIKQNELKNYGGRNLSPHEFLRLQTHLETCEECQRRLDKMFPNIAEKEEALFLEDLRETADEDFHLNYEEHLKPFVYETISAVDREIVESHVETCADCREDLRDLLEFHEELEREKEIRELSKSSWWKGLTEWFSASNRKTVWFALASIIFLIGAGLMWLLVSRPTIEIVQNQANTSDSQTNQSSVNTIQPPIAENKNLNAPKANQANQNTDLPEKEIEMAALVLPKFLNDLRIRDNQTLRGEGDFPTQKIAVSAPNGIVIRTSSPVLSWENVPKIETYEVAVFDADFNRVAKFENVRSNSQQLTNLAKGKIYQWQVVGKSVSADGKETRFLGQGKFYIVSERDENKINKSQNSLERGKALAEAGLLVKAAAEFRKYLKENPNSENAKKFLRQVERAQR